VKAVVLNTYVTLRSYGIGLLAEQEALRYGTDFLPESDVSFPSGWLDRIHD
jgi:hypothetical protein